MSAPEPEHIGQGVKRFTFNGGIVVDVLPHAAKPGNDNSQRKEAA